ncbi:MAG TPA: hypothetical protein VHP63_03555, partial [candidate division Zixibacteria bacterium]|nr:hypothetical protein [candidate division Zixibacteria bacterium]
MATHEHTINDALAATLRDTRRVWNSANVVISENTGLLKGSSKRPDILVLEPFVSPVVIEAEIGPALSVEVDTISRLGSELRNTGRMILSSVSVRYPKRLVSKQGKELRKELDKSTDLEFALYTGITPSNWTRWPKTGWIHGSVSALSLLVQTAAVPPDVIDAAANQLVFGVTEAAGLLDELSLKFPGAIQKICEQLCQEDSEQTRRMAATILANALVFQESLAGSTGDLANVKSLEELRGSKTGLTKATILLEWRKILKVNYWPIFDIARRILELVPASETSPILDRLSKTAANLMENRLMRSHDLTGAVFQRLIVDRKFLAAFYTTPSSAALLIGLAVLPNKTPGGGSWASAQDVKAIRIGDFACGTGTLLSTAYQRIGQLHELSGGDSEAIHPEMMANCIIGCDVLPAAAHLTASMISGAHPTVKYYQSRIFTLAYGRQANGGIALGSLDLLDSQRKLEILDITAKVAGAFGEKESELWMEIPDASFDLVIM